MRNKKVEVKILRPSTKQAKKSQFQTAIFKLQFRITVNCFGNKLASLSTMELIFSACMVKLCNQ